MVAVDRPWGDPTFERLALDHAAEVWPDQKLSPSFISRLAAEEQAGLLVALVALHRASEYDIALVGYNLLHYTRNLLTDEPLLSDVGFYLEPRHRRGWLALKLLQAQKDLGSQLGARCIAGYVTVNRRLDKLYERAGFKRVSTGFAWKGE